MDGLMARTTEPGRDKEGRMAKTHTNDTPRQDDATSVKKESAVTDMPTKLILTGADIVAIGEEAEILVGGKNYNTALISQIAGYARPSSGLYPPSPSTGCSTRPRSTPR